VQSNIFFLSSKPDPNPEPKVRPKPDPKFFFILSTTLVAGNSGVYILETTSPLGEGKYQPMSCGEKI
jgi:hypothetical protein